MPNSSRMLIIIMVLIITLAVGFGAGFLTSQAADNALFPFFNPTKTPKASGLDLIKEAWNKLETEYVEPAKLTADNITASAIKAIVEALQDPHMSYLTAEELNYLQTRFQGSFDGIGAVVSIRDGELTIASVIKGAPAEGAGMVAGDIIKEINGEKVEGMSLDIAISKIRGPSGTVVQLLVLHPDAAEPVIMNITRAKVDVPSVAFEMRGDIAVISIYQFTDRTEKELLQVLPKLKQENAAGIVLDLRGNPGGILGIVVQIASHFIPEGVIVSVRSNQGVVQTYSSEKMEITTDLPMVVLVDENSASGSEVLSGALQDHHRALVAGTVTYGKGSVNILQPLSDGSGIYITTSRWLTPDGRMIEGNGITPDILLDTEGEEEMQWALDYLHNN